MSLPDYFAPRPPVTTNRFSPPFEPAPEPTPPVDEYDDPARERLLRQIDDQDAVIRRRNEQIHADRAEIAGLREQLKVLQTKGDRLNTLRALQDDIGEANAAKGFHDRGALVRGAHRHQVEHCGHMTPKPTTLRNAEDSLRDYATSRLALITTEVAEAIEELRHGRAVDETYYSGGVTPGHGLAEDAKVDYHNSPRKPEGVPSEIADIVIRAFDFAHEFDIDLAAMIDEKLAYNATRPMKHGKEF